MRKSQRWLLTTAALVVPLALVAGCSSTGGGSSSDSPTPTTAAGPYGGEVGTPAQEQALADLYKKAQDNNETSVTIYGPPAGQIFIDAFQKRFPDITLNYQQLQSQNRITKLQADQASGNYVADLAIDGTTPIYTMADEWCDVFDPVTPDLVPAANLDDGGKIVLPNNTVFGIVINTNLISAADAPTTWDDVVDPKWKGKEVMVSPGTGGAGAFANAMLLTPAANASKWGMDIVQKLHDNVATVAQDAQTVSSVLDGTYPIGVLGYFPFYWADIQQTPNAPLKFLLFTDGGTPWSRGAGCLLKNAPDPDAANLFMNWEFTKEGQTALAQSGAYPVVPGIPGPGGLPPADQAGLITLLDPKAAITDYAPFVKQVQGMYGS